MDKVMAIKRYDMEAYDCITYLHDDGDWCKHEDVLELEAELNALRNPWRTDEPPKDNNVHILVMSKWGDPGVVFYCNEMGHFCNDEYMNTGSCLAEYGWVGWMPIPKQSELMKSFARDKNAK